MLPNGTHTLRTYVYNPNSARVWEACIHIWYLVTVFRLESGSTCDRVVDTEATVFVARVQDLDKARPLPNARPPETFYAQSDRQRHATRFRHTTWDMARSILQK